LHLDKSNDQIGTLPGSLPVARMLGIKMTAVFLKTTTQMGAKKMKGWN